MGKNFQSNYSLYLQEDTLSKLKFLSQTSGVSMAKIVNQVMSEYLAKFSADLAEIENVARTAACKVKEKLFGENVKKVTMKKIPTNTGARLAAVLDDQIIAAVKVEKVDEEKAMEFIQEAMSTIGSNSYEITRTEKSIVVTVDEQTLSQEFEDASTSERVESLIDEVIAQITKKAFQNQEI